MYLGKGKVVLEDFVRNSKDEQEGHRFAFIYSYENKTDDEIMDVNLSINTYQRKHNIDILKGNKKLTEMVRKVNLEFPIIKEYKNDSTWYSYRENLKLTVE